MKKVYAITGGIGSGKSTVSAIIKSIEEIQQYLEQHPVLLIKAMLDSPECQTKLGKTDFEERAFENIINCYLYSKNEKLKELIPGFKNKNYQVVVVTGKGYIDDYKDVKTPDNVRIVPFLDNFINVLKDTDLIVSRAGASTIAEITAIGLPAILVPSPYVTHNHQYMNAKELEDLGACSIVSEDEFGKDRLISEIDNLLNNSEAYSKMASASKKLGVSDSATKIYNEIRKIIG